MKRNDAEKVAIVLPIAIVLTIPRELMEALVRQKQIALDETRVPGTQMLRRPGMRRTALN